MHTAFTLQESMFRISSQGQATSRDALFEWGPLDRLGIVMDRPFGALGAGLAVSLAISAFYDVPAKNRRKRPIYPEVYLFHKGGPWGNFIAFDFFPEQKEVFLAIDPVELLPAIKYPSGGSFNYPQVVARVIPVSALRLKPLTRL